ncbi:hypothetical protein [Thermogymnomonas acidicola]|uniref:hypothetical protein n=1 Tax=Thermogymnomonas acidicola TaxID=399579 RepID=UPI0013969E5E|nr:hypothetical protein [Thermogymnomonas acidicola]
MAMNFPPTGAPVNVSGLIQVKGLANLIYHTIEEYEIKPTNDVSGIIDFNDVPPGSTINNLVEYSLMHLRTGDKSGN